MSYVRSVLLLGAVMLFVGCMQEGQSVKVPPAKDPLTTAKAMLEDVAKTGKVGSAIGGVKYSLTELKKTDPAKAEMVEQGAASLLQLSDKPEQAKAKAKEILSKL